MLQRSEHSMRCDNSNRLFMHTTYNDVKLRILLKIIILAKSCQLTYAQLTINLTKADLKYASKFFFSFQTEKFKNEND